MTKAVPGGVVDKETSPRAPLERFFHGLMHINKGINNLCTLLNLNAYMYIYIYILKSFSFFLSSFSFFLSFFLFLFSTLRGDLKLPSNILAGFAGCAMTRACSRAAFQKHGRSALVTDMIQEMHSAFTYLFEMV